MNEILEDVLGDVVLIYFVEQMLHGTLVIVVLRRMRRVRYAGHQTEEATGTHLSGLEPRKSGLGHGEVVVVEFQNVEGFQTTVFAMLIETNSISSSVNGIWLSFEVRSETANLTHTISNNTLSIFFREIRVEVKIPKEKRKYENLVEDIV